VLVSGSCDDDETDTARDAIADSPQEALPGDGPGPIDATEVGSQDHPDVGDGSVLDADASDADMRGCTLSPTPPEYPFQCFEGSAGICSDQAENPTCVSGEWQCGAQPGGMPKLRTDQCRCFITPPPPGQICECTDAGRQCRPTDAGMGG
jgi:hypothetical protein